MKCIRIFEDGFLTMSFKFNLRNLNQVWKKTTYKIKLIKNQY
jgi:hypothetical protein